jgi:hemerythrin
MPLFVWTEEMKVGVEEIDAEHRKLMEVANALHEAIEQGADRATLETRLDALVVLTVSHFVHEERLFAKTNYPDREAHAAIHAELKRQIVEIYDRFKDGESAVLNEGFTRFLKRWLIEHVTNTDRKYGAHLNACGVM